MCISQRTEDRRQKTDAILSSVFCPPSSERGISLIELIMFIVIVSIALAGITLVMNRITGNSSGTLERKQAQAAAESLLEEIEAHAISGVSNTVTQANRPNAHIVPDYNGFATSGVFPADGTLTAVSGLGNYNVAVAVAAVGLGNIPVASAVKITVTVTDPVGQAATATGYRTAY